MPGSDDRAAEIAALGVAARTALDHKHEAREVALRASRKIIQSCAASIRAVHREEFDEADRLASEARQQLEEAGAAVVDEPDLRYSGYFQDAAKEYAEAVLTAAMVRGEPLPRAETVGVEMPAYLNGLAEAASELRRRMLDILRRGEIEKGEGLLEVMEEVYSLLVTMDYPDAVSGGLRRRTDALRAVLERTRADLTTTLLQARLQESLDRHLPPE